MNSLTLSASTSQPPVIKCSRPAVYIDGARRQDLAVKRWEISGPPQFGELTLTGALAGLTDRPDDLDDRSLPAVGSTVSIVFTPPEGGVSFVGVVDSHRYELADDDEGLVAVCIPGPAAELSARLAGKWQLAGDDAAEMPASQLRFNTDRNSLASASEVNVAGRSCKAFDSSPTAKPWTVADALGYLLAVSVRTDVDVPSAEELERVAGRVPLGALEATGLQARAVISEVLDGGGLSISAAGDGTSLRVYRPGTDGRRRTVCLQSPGQTFRADSSNLWTGKITFTERPARRGVLVLGRRKRYESTFQLAKGWDESSESSCWRDFAPSASSKWAKLASVYRKWVLNEHGWYSRLPWSIPRHDFSDISATDFVAGAPRTFLPCLSAGADGQSFGTVVEYRTSSQGNWRRWRGPAWAAQDQCAIYLGGDGLPGDYFQAATAGTVEVRVTCTVESDVHLSAEIAGDPGAGREVFDMSAVAGWDQVHPTSAFSGAEDVGPAAVRDDSAALSRLARRKAEAIWSATEAVLTLAWVDTSYRVGDIIERVDGRQFELCSNPDTRPFIRSIVHEFGTKQTTRLYVSG